MYTHNWGSRQGQHFPSNTFICPWINPRTFSAEGLCSTSLQHCCMNSHRMSPMCEVTGRAGFLPLSICTTTWWSLRHSAYGTFPVKTCKMMQPKEYMSDANWGELASSSSSEILKFSGAVHRTLLVIYDVPLSSEQNIRIPWSATIASPFSSMRILFPVRSPWTIHLECKYWRAEATLLRICSFRMVERFGELRPRNIVREPPSIHGETIAGSGPNPWDIPSRGSKLLCSSWIFRCSSLSSLSMNFFLKASSGISILRLLTATNRGCPRCVHFHISPKFPWAVGYREDSLFICPVRSGRLHQCTLSKPAASANTWIQLFWMYWRIHPKQQEQPPYELIQPGLYSIVRGQVHELWHKLSTRRHSLSDARTLGAIMTA